MRVGLYSPCYVRDAFGGLSVSGFAGGGVDEMRGLCFFVQIEISRLSFIACYACVWQRILVDSFYPIHSSMYL